MAASISRMPEAIKAWANHHAGELRFDEEVEALVRTCSDAGSIPAGASPKSNPVPATTTFVGRARDPQRSTALK